MNRLLISNKENTETRIIFVCILCHKPFCSERALLSHMRFHSNDSGTSNGATAQNLSSIPHNQIDNPSGGSWNRTSTVFNGAPPHNQIGDLNATSFSEDDLINLNARFIMSPNLSSPRRYQPPSIPPFGNNPIIGFPLDPSCLGSNRGFPYNINEIHPCSGGMSMSNSADASQNFHHPDRTNHPFSPLLSAEYPYQEIDSDPSPLPKEPTRGFLPPSPVIDELGQRHNSSIVKPGGSKRPYLGDEDELPVDAEEMIASKRPKIGSSSRAGNENAENRQVPVFQAVEDPTSGIASSSVGEEENEDGLDLSLHL